MKTHDTLVAEHQCLVEVGDRVETLTLALADDEMGCGRAVAARLEANVGRRLQWNCHACETLVADATILYASQSSMMLVLGRLRPMEVV